MKRTKTGKSTKSTKSSPIYEIEYCWDTGDSNGSKNGLLSILEGTYKNIEIAKENIKRIAEHYEYYRLMNDTWAIRCYKGKEKAQKEKERNKKLEEAKSKPWYNEKYDFVLKLLADNGKEYEISAPWCGYFDRLNSVRVILAKDNAFGPTTDGMSYYF
jgi:hypothetical protein